VRTTTIKLSLAALAFTAGLTACGDAKATDVAQEDLQRDLQLASATTMNLATPRVDSALLNSMETKALSAPEVATTVRRGAGTRAVRSEAPTVEAAPDVDVAAVEESEEVEAESIAPVPEPITEPVAVAPRPAPTVIPTAGTGDYGTGGSGGGIFGGGGGVVIRGGGVDGDNCELHGGRRGTSRGPIYFPSPRSTPSTVVRPRSPGFSIGSRTMSSGIGSRSVARPRVSQPASRPSAMRPRSR
jgi:hypothetical protein